FCERGGNRTRDLLIKSSRADILTHWEPTAIGQQLRTRSPVTNVICFPHMEGRRSPSEIAEGGPKASGALLRPPPDTARAYRLHSSSLSGLRRARHGSGTRPSPAQREPCTARACASRLPSTAWSGKRCYSNHHAGWIGRGANRLTIRIVADTSNAVPKSIQSANS